MDNQLRCLRLKCSPSEESGQGAKGKWGGKEVKGEEKSGVLAPRQFQHKNTEELMH